MHLLIAFILILAMSQQVFAGDFFNCDDLTYFSDSCQAKVEERQNALNSQRPRPERPDENIWAEPMMGADGTVTYKIPPMPVMKVLQDPSGANVKDYIDWNDKRSAAISRATEAIQQYAAASIKAQIDKDKIDSVEFYFQPECSFSKAQAPILQQLANKLGQDKVVGFAMNVASSQSLLQFIAETGITFKVVGGDQRGAEAGVTAWPTMLVRTVSGKVRRIDGFKESIETALITGPNNQPDSAALNAYGAGQCSGGVK